MQTVVKDYFNKLITQPDEQIDLLRAALSIASDAYPDLDANRYLVQIKLWAEQIKNKLPKGADVQTRLHVLNHFLFNKLGFIGNSENYYDPRNSYLNEVLDRRCGIPISLSVVYIKLGNLLGLDVSGVSFPGHFLVKLPYDEGEVVIDPFNGGVSLSEKDLTIRLETLFNTEIENLTPFLQPASNRDILIRMLSNLKGIHHHRADVEKTLEVINKILLLDPQRSEEYRERGLMLTSLECFHSALQDLRRYLSSNPKTGDIDSVRELIIQLQRKHSYLN